jgi:hypothetical protein
VLDRLILRPWSESPEVAASMRGPPYPAMGNESTLEMVSC